ncbi:hypothetical protein BBG47_19965 [Paenibacillus sp. KS1]|uniref:hypothetical protein n=1 Tax=Paenibacillus sp. KS1 TaxID=1849249 RepID=UPI0008067236|nr:hypothetical protein [Paenibacillus sp. KS1]OBY77768.1 hypothetical protein BBG47_19965 [Paenibacillus sp. KS1]
MKKTWKVIIMALVFGLVVSGCGSKGETTQNEGNNSAVATNTEQQTEKNESKDDKQHNDSLGKIEIIGEKTKKIGSVEITMEEGQVYERLKMANGEWVKPVLGRYLVIKGKIIPNKDINGSIWRLSAYEAGDLELGENYIGAATGNLGEYFESNLVTMVDLQKNQTYEGYFYLNVSEKDAYRILYEDDYTTKDYWDIKITK